MNHLISLADLATDIVYHTPGRHLAWLWAGTLAPPVAVALALLT